MKFSAALCGLSLVSASEINFAGLGSAEAKLSFGADEKLTVTGAVCLDANLCNSKELSPSAWTMVASAKQPSRWPLTVDGQKKLLGFYEKQIDTENWWRTDMTPSELCNYALTPCPTTRTTDMSPYLETAAQFGYKVDVKVHDCNDESFLTHSTSFDPRALLQIMGGIEGNKLIEDSTTYNWISPASRRTNGLSTPLIRKVDVSKKATGVHPYNVNTGETVTASSGAGSATEYAKVDGQNIPSNFMQFGEGAMRSCSSTASQQCWALWDGGGGSTHIKLGATGLDYYHGICADDALQVNNPLWPQGGSKKCHDSLKNDGGAHQGLTATGCLSQHTSIFLDVDASVCQSCPASYTGGSMNMYGCYNNNDAGRNACVSIKRSDVTIHTSGTGSPAPAPDTDSSAAP